MGDLSKHFSKSEFKCPHCGKIIINMQLISKLEEIRKAIGNRPIIITSGYRCKTYNASIDGCLNSPHIEGLAADIKVYDFSIIDLALRANIVQEIRLGLYPNHLHIDIKKPSPSKYWLVREYNSTPIYSKNEKDLKKFLKGVIDNVIN